MPRDGKTKITPEELEKGIDGYFAECKDNNKPFLFIGLAVYLKVHRDTLLNYSNMSEFSALLKKAKDLSEFTLMEAGLSGTSNPTMSIFLLKVNHGMQDKIVTENLNTDTVTNITIVEDKSKNG